MLAETVFFINEDRGGIGEYTAILVMILIIAVGSIALIGPKIKGVFEAIGSKL